MKVNKTLTFKLDDEELDTLESAALILDKLYNIIRENDCYDISIKDEAKFSRVEIDTARYVLQTLSDFLIEWNVTD